ncbi:hypothetical protein GCM10020229_56380 [Kitasatospora albolonga]|uniref:eCIS core domain-containing protein n=1 Tax=Kitasatospora albolonga TaxID=68173 RepID=UPI0031ECFEF6
MREYEHEGEGGGSGLRPRAGRDGAGPGGVELRAAVDGRPEVLGAAGLLGLQRVAGNAAVGAVLEEGAEEARSPVHEVVAGGGEALEPAVRQDMEARLGHDFGDVRVHTDQAAHDSARSVDAHAYTVGSHVVFQRDAYDPGSHRGRTTLAHELTHVVQQRAGAVDGTETAGGVRVSDPGDRFEREAADTADRVTAEPSVQRAEEDELPTEE